MRADADSRLTARPARSRGGGCVMPNSQIEMVIKDNRQPGGWRVCGEFTEDPGGQVDVYVVVRQGDVVARGGDVVTQKSGSSG